MQRARTTASIRVPRLPCATHDLVHGGRTSLTLSPPSTVAHGTRPECIWSMAHSRKEGGDGDGRRGRDPAFIVWQPIPSGARPAGHENAAAIFAWLSNRQRKGISLMRWPHVLVTPGGREGDGKFMREGPQRSVPGGTRVRTHGLDVRWRTVPPDTDSVKNEHGNGKGEGGLCGRNK